MVTRLQVRVHAARALGQLAIDSSEMSGVWGSASRPAVSSTRAFSSSRRGEEAPFDQIQSNRPPSSFAPAPAWVDPTGSMQHGSNYQHTKHNIQPAGGGLSLTLIFCCAGDYSFQVKRIRVLGWQTHCTRPILPSTPHLLLLTMLV